MSVDAIRHVWQIDGMNEPDAPKLPDYSHEVKTTWRVPERVKAEVSSIAAERGLSETIVVAEFLQWAVNAWRKGHRP